MKKRVPCLILLVALAAALFTLRRALPVDRRALIEKKYAGWSGVLSLWYCEGFQPGEGSAAGWLNRCVAAFEKAHPGVYVQPTEIVPEAMARWSEGGLTPDLLLFPPSTLTSPAGLASLDPAPALRGDLARLGDWDGVCHALPVAMGGYARVESEAGGAAPVLPADDDYHLWSAASALLEEKPASPEQLPAPGLDLGLPASAPVSADPWRRFVDGETSALLASQRELRRLEALREQGKGPEWSIAAVSAFTDQLLFVAVPRGAPERQALATAFAADLLSEGCQGELRRAGLLPVTEAWGGYEPADALGRLEALLREQAILAPRAFGVTWRAAARQVLADPRAETFDARREALRQALE